MLSEFRSRWKVLLPIAGGGMLAAGLLAGAAVADGWPKPSNAGTDRTVAGEARAGSLTLELSPAVRGVRVIEGRTPGRPLVVLDPGHGGRDPGATSASGEVVESQITLQLARELRDRLSSAGRVRVALTRDADSALDLATRAAIGRRLGADLFVSIHADSAPNPLARGATVYSLSEVASDVDAARFAALQDHSEGEITSATDGSVRALLADLAVRDEMESSADFAGRLLRKASGRVPLRPEPHRFAAFRVLRAAEAPAVLFEAGYISNVDDEALLRSPQARARIVRALAEAIETQLAVGHAKR